MKNFIVWTKRYTAYGYEVKAETAEQAREKYLEGNWSNIREEELMVDEEEDIIKIEEDAQENNS